MIKKSTEIKKTQINSYYLMGKALMLTFKLVSIPTILLFFGLIIDKRLNTTPFFIVLGFIAGLFFGFFKALDIKKHFMIK